MSTTFYLVVLWAEHTSALITSSWAPQGFPACSFVWLAARLSRSDSSINSSNSIQIWDLICSDFLESIWVAGLLIRWGGLDSRPAAATVSPPRECSHNRLPSDVGKKPKLASKSHLCRMKLDANKSLALSDRREGYLRVLVLLLICSAGVGSFFWFVSFS